MNKSELVEALSKKMNIPVKDVQIVTDTIFDAMSETLAKGQRIEIRGFGNFKVKEYDSYTGRNPTTGEKIKVKPKKMPVFKAGKNMFERLNGRG